MTAHDGANILELPYLDRQIIVVADDADVEAAKEGGPKASKSALDGFDWSSLAAFATAYILPVGRLGLPALGFGIPVAILAVPVAALAQHLSGKAVDAYRDSRQPKSSGQEILFVKRSAAEQIAFPIGHPRAGVVYVGHPTIPKRYYRMADFHKVIFEHKLCEGVRLLMNLGAVEILVKHESGWSRDFAAHLSVPLSSTTGNAAFQASTDAKAQAQVLFEARSSGSTNPSLPRDLMWYEHEPTWQVVAEGRLHHGLETFSIDVSYTDDLGINVGLAAKAKDFGLELGGNFEAHRSTVWRIAGRFAPIPRPSETTKGRITAKSKVASRARATQAKRK